MIRWLVFIYSTIVLPYLVNAQDTLVVERLDYQLLSYEEGKYDAVGELDEVYRAGVLLDCQGETIIEVCNPHPIDVWVDGRLTHHLKTKCMYISRNDLCLSASRDTVFMVLISSKPLKDIQLNAVEIKQSEKSGDYNLLRRGFARAWSSSGYFIMLACIVAAWLVQPFSTGKLHKPDFEGEFYRFMHIDNLVLLGLILVLNAFCWTQLFGTKTFGHFVEWVLILGAAWLIKIIGTLLFGGIFSFVKQASWQLNAWVNYWTYFSIGLFLLLFFETLFFHRLMLDTAVYNGIIAIILTLSAILISFIFMFRQTSKSLHIFIYLCVTEILPVSLVVFWLLK